MSQAARTARAVWLEKEDTEVVELTKLNGEPLLINALQIEMVESIPESKIIMMNGTFHIVMESRDEVRRKVIEFFRSSFVQSKLEA